MDRACLAPRLKRCKADLKPTTWRRYILRSGNGWTWTGRTEMHGKSEIDARHGYKHGWIIVNGYSFDRHMAFPHLTFANVWD